MGDYISELPDDILCDIFSYLTIKDAIRVKSLSPRWKDLPDTRTLLQFDASTIDGGKHFYSEHFVEAVNQFFKIWRVQKASALKIKYYFRPKYDSLIDGWIATAISKEIEELDLDFSFDTNREYGSYVFSCHLLDTDCLKHLRLNFCKLTMVCHASTRWLSKLLTLELIDIPLCMSDFECIISNSPNLESLKTRWGFRRCERLFIQHPSLKKLEIVGFCDVKPSCPKLQTSTSVGGYFLTFSNVPLLTALKLCFRHGICSPEFSDLALLQSLSLWLRIELLPLPPSTTMSCLKHLDLFVRGVRPSFNLLTIMHMLYASPVLETLNLKLDNRSRIQQSEGGRYLDRPHLHLKEVKIEGLMHDYRFLLSELIEYLLRNGVSLQQIVFIVDAELISSPTKNLKSSMCMWQTINPAVELILRPPTGFICNQIMCEVFKQNCRACKTMSS